MRRVAVTPLLLSSLMLAPAAADTIATDRPDFVESSLTVGAGRVQIETSIAQERDDSGGGDSTLFSTPTLLRIGIAEHWELRLESDGYQDWQQDGAGADVSGYADLSVGAKYHVPDSGGAGDASLGWLFHVDVDSGSSPFRGQDLRPSVRFVAEWALSDSVGLGFMPGLIYEVDEAGERYTAAIVGIVLGQSLTDHTRIFAEYAASQIASDEHGGSPQTVDFGIAHLLSNSCQIDAAVARGLNDDTADWSATLGLSMKF